MQDIYTWRVIYQDETYTDEFDETRPDGRGFAELEDKPIIGIELHDFLKAVASVAFPHKEDVQPVFFRRRYIALTGIGERSTVHCIGWKWEESACYLFVFADGSSLMTDDLQAV